VVEDIPEPMPDISNTSDGTGSSNGGGEPQSLRVVTNSNAAIDESLEPMPMVASDNFDSDNKPEWWKLVALAVDYYQNPDLHQNLQSNENPIGEVVTDLLKISVGKKVIPAHMRIDELSDLDDDTLKRACANYIKNILITDQANYYRRLGVQQDSTLEQIRIHYRYLFRLFQGEQEAGNNERDDTYIRRINLAFSTLRSDEKRKEYDSFLAEQPLDSHLNRNSGFDEPGQANDLDEAAPYVPAMQVEPRDSKEDALSEKGSGVYWLVLIVCLIMAGGGAFYYLQPNLDDIKSKITMSFSDLMPATVAPDATPEKEIKVVELIVEEPIVEEPVVEEPVAEESAVEGEPVVVKIDKPTVAEVVVKKEPSLVKPVVVEKRVEADIIEVKPIPKKIAKAEPKPVIKKPVIMKPAPKPVVPVAVPKPTVVAKAEPVIKQPLPIENGELLKLVSLFSLFYEDGELDDFMGLFSKDVLTNNDENYASIRSDYRSLFKGTEMRVIDFKDMVWSDKTAEKATGNGKFIVTVLRHNAEKIQKFTGFIKLDVVKIDGNLKVVGMFHEYGE